MILFSPGGRQLIAVAVDNLGDPRRKEVWQRWAAANPRVRLAGDPWDDEGDPLPREIVEIALLALSELVRKLRAERDRVEHSEDDVADLDNDLSQIKAVIRLLTEGAPARLPMVVS
jgi:hypothetical protein